MSDTQAAWWSEEVRQLGEDAIQLPGMPVHVFLTEAGVIARFIQEYWEPNATLNVPGLKQVEKRVPFTLASEINDLVLAAQEAQTDILFAQDPNVELRKKAERAQKLQDDLEAAIDFVLDDGVDEALDQHFAEARKRLDDTQSVAALAQRLSDYARIAQELGNRMLDAGDFDLAWIDEARGLASELATAGGAPLGRPSKPGIALRDRLLTLLRQRVQRVRKAATYVFRDHPDILRRATSAYERRRRAETRRRDAETAEAQG